MIVRIAFYNLLRRKSGTIVNITFLVLALMILLISSTYANSINQYFQEFMSEAKGFRTLNVNTFKSDTTILPRLKKIVDKEERIVDLYHNCFSVLTHIEDTSGLLLHDKYKDDETVGQVLVNQYISANERNVIKGRTIENNERNVGLIPQFFLPIDAYEVDFWNHGDIFVDSASLIGKNITLTYYARDYNTQKFDIIKTFTYTFEVIGTYNNLVDLFEPNEIIIPYLDVLEIVNNMNINNVGLSEDFNITYNIEVDSLDHVLDVQNYLFDEGFDSVPETSLGYEVAVGSQIYSNIGMMTAYIVLIISGALIAMSTYRSIQARKKEIAMLQVVGYKNIQLMKIFVIEMVMIGFAGLIISMMIYFTGCFIGNRIIESNVSLYMQEFRITYITKQLFLNVIFALVIPTLAGIFASKEILNIEPMDVLYERRS